MKNKNTLPRLKKIKLPIEAHDKRIKPNTFYLAKIDVWDEKNRRGFMGWFTGIFVKKQWGWNFKAVYSAGYPYDCPGWKELYEIIDNDKELKKWLKEMEEMGSCC